MNRKILLSLGLVVFVAAAAITTTGAFFSDSETSTGNTFTAGAIDLKVDSQAHYNHMVCTLGVGDAPIYTWQPEAGFTPDANTYPVQGTPCEGTWTLTDLGPTNHFFNFGDVKPGDQGEDTVSLHIDNNPAYACAYINTTSNSENTYTGPEITAGDVSSTTGELAQNIHFFTWMDNASTSEAVPGDNIWQAGEPITAGPLALSSILNATTTLTLADGGTGNPLPPTSTNYIGVAWCAGTLDVSTPGTILCDGAPMGNESQTDSVTADITFHVEQSRNNSGFRCVPSEEEIPQTATVTLDKIVTFTNIAIAGVDVSDYTLHLVGPGGDHILTDEVPLAGLTPGAYTVSEVYSGDPADATSTAVFSGSCSEIGTTDTATMNVVAGVNPTCTITNSVSSIQH